MSFSAMVNVLSFHHPHVHSIYEEGLWGLPDDKRGVNRRRWELLSPGSRILLYAEFRDRRGVWALCTLEDKEYAPGRPVRYWDPPTGFPLLIRLRPEIPERLSSPEDLERVSPILREELLSAFSISRFRPPQDRWSILLFGDTRRGATYSGSTFEKILLEFRARNSRAVSLERPDHEEIKEAIYQAGLLQGRFPVKEYPIEDRRIDVVWRRTEKSVPYIAWEVSLSKDGLFRDLTKLKHAFDLWNAIPVLVTTPDLMGRAERWVRGSFHEVAHVFRIVDWRKVRELYKTKSRTKRLEREIGIA
ncbi:MAG: hypothetical protein DRO06_01995 [Thermoproteota archaeon]|nr:MAG: hypothetical protein DRO06_01995 [Candidatus Korarchaeota archaeon]